MSHDRTLNVALMVVVVAIAYAAPARAQDAKVEIGAGLAGLNFRLGDNNNDDSTSFTIPATGFGFLTPGVYTSIFIGPRFSVEPQLGLILAKDENDDDVNHFVSIAGQGNYFFRNTRESAPYVFGSVGTLDVSGSNNNPTFFSGGGGYRFRVGSNLAFRVDGRYTHFTDESIDLVTFTLSIGGLLGR